jgi:hypothetical protein
MDKRPDNFEKDLCILINKYSKENDSNTPDFILAEYLMMCLSNFNVIMNKRDGWYKDSNKVASKVTKFIKHSRNKVKKVFGLD